MKPLSDAFSPEVMAELSRPVQSYDPRDAQIVPGTKPIWYVFEIASRKVEADLIKRRFGIYVPMCEEVTVERGRKIDRKSLLFPGYVFVFFWATIENYSKVAGIRGIISSIGELTDEELNKIRVLENYERPIELQYFSSEDQIPSKKRRRWRKSRKPLMVPDEIVRTRAWSAFDDFVHKLDGDGRSEALRQMLDDGRLRQ